MGLRKFRQHKSVGALTICYRGSSVDSNIPGTSLDQGGSWSQRSLNHYSLLHRCRKAFEGPESKGPKNPWSKKGVQPVTGMGVAGSVIRIKVGFQKIPTTSREGQLMTTLRLQHIRLGPPLKIPITSQIVQALFRRFR